MRSAEMAVATPNSNTVHATLKGHSSVSIKYDSFLHFLSVSHL